MPKRLLIIEASDEFIYQQIILNEGLTIPQIPTRARRYTGVALLMQLLQLEVKIDIRNVV
jgi:hypothetical protein